jgi:hypothetical protein
MHLNNKWQVNVDTGKWISSNDRLDKSDYDAIREELQKLRFYQKCLSGSTYVGVHSPAIGNQTNSDIDNIYGILDNYTPRSFYYDGLNIPYIQQFTPPLPEDATLIGTTQSILDFTSRDMGEYNFTLKNLFTPERLINDQKENLFYVDLTTTESIDDISIKFESLIVDSIRAIDGHRILLKDQYESVTILSSIDPDTYFYGGYEVESTSGGNTTYKIPSSENGVYTYNKRRLVRSDELDDYDSVLKYSICSKLGNINREKQFKLSRLNSGYFPLWNSTDPTYPSSPVLGDSLEFVESHNWVLRNRMDYNNLFELVLNDTLKHGTQSFQLELNSGSQSNYVTYSIPESTLSVGEFGVIFNHQEGVTNIIDSKYKVTLRSISETSRYYWVCGDEGVVLRINKHDHAIKRIKLEFREYDPKTSSSRQVITTLKSISFFNELRGCIVGKFNQIWVTSDGGKNWKQIYLPDFDGYNFNSVTFSNIDRFYVGGDNGVFIEFEYKLGNWQAHKRRISKYVDGFEDEYVLVDDINDIHYFNSSNLEFVAIGCENNILYLYDISGFINSSNPNLEPADFWFVQDDSTLINDFGNISSVTWTNGSNLVLSTLDSIYETNVFNGTVSSTSSNILSASFSIISTQSGVNSLFSDDVDLLSAGNFSLWQTMPIGSTVSTNVYDSDYFNRLKPRLLFLDYDIGSKLYWFDDYGQYRLPDRTSVDVDYLLSGGSSYLAMNPNTETLYNSNTMTTMTYSETNWITYWKDRQKTFEYYTSLDESNVVEPSFTFSSSIEIGKTFSYSTASISVDYNDILPLMPSATPLHADPNVDQESRYRSIAGTLITAPMSSSDLFFWDYLGVWKTTVIDTDTPPEVGDVLRINSDVFDGKFVINKILRDNCKKVNTGGTATFKISGKIPYTSQEIRVSGVSLTDGVVSAFPVINPPASTWATLLSDAINANTVNGLGHGYTSTIFNSGLTWFITIQAPSYIVAVSYDRTYERTTTNTQAFSWATVNICDYYSYFYTDFTQNILNNIPQSTQNTVVRNLNKYPVGVTQSNVDYFVDNFNDHYANLSYDCEVVGGNTQSFMIEGKYSQWSAYYNLQSKIDVFDGFNTDTYSTEIKYPSGFLNFGYTPTYNLLSYLNYLNPGEYLPTKEFYSMPNYELVPGPNSPQPLTDQIYIDVGVETNLLKIGSNLKHIWDSLLKWTFVDVTVDGPLNSNVLTERLLIINKDYDSINDWYIVEFHDKLNYSTSGDIDTINITSRRTLQQISDDLQYINRLHRPEWLSQVSYDKTLSLQTGSWLNYETDIDFKIPTDSYCKVLLSDSKLLADLTGVFYTDYKYELATQVTKLKREYSFNVSSITVNGGYYQFNFIEPHRLDNYDQVLVGLNGVSTDYPEELLGVHHIKVVNAYSIKVPILSIGLYPTQNFNISHIKNDDFLNFQPVDLFDMGVGDKKIKQSVEIPIEKYDIDGAKYNLVDIDLTKYKFRLIDGLDLVTLNARFPWILDAEISDAVIGLDSNGGLVWYKGLWFCGRWFGGRWVSGRWLSGDWYSGEWTSKFINNGYIKIDIDEQKTDFYNSIWYGGRWFGGEWDNGTWYDGRWYNGTWNNGRWFDGTWNDGTWENGFFKSGIWVLGEWRNGIYNQTNGPSYWLDGKFTGGDFENGTWYNGVFDEKNDKVSRFGTKSTNSRPSLWRSGKFLRGQFHSYLNVDGDGNPEVSLSHKYSKWKTGLFAGGDFYGGVSSLINFKNTTWHGGISECVDVTYINATSSTITLDGEYDFNVNDEFYLVDDGNGGTFSLYGSVEDPRRYSVLNTDYDSVNDTTDVAVSVNLLTSLTNNPIEGYWNLASITTNFDFTLTTIVPTYSVTSYSNAMPDLYVDSNWTIINQSIDFVQSNPPGLSLTWPVTYNSTDITFDVGFGSFDYDVIYGPNALSMTFSMIPDPLVPSFRFLWYFEKIPLSGTPSNLKAVSSFDNSRWDSGIWYNGVFIGGQFNGGSWYDGYFEGNWG